MKKPLILASSIVMFAVSIMQGQPTPARYGKVDIADLQMKVYDLDTTADAVILCDYGEFDANNFQFTRLKRIKVLKKEGADRVPLVFNVENLGDLRGSTFNLENGEVVQSKLKNESIYKERLYGNLYRYRVTMPDVRVGSVVDIQYSFPGLPSEWKFQDEIPVRWSELRIGNSPYIEFQKVFYGFAPLFVNESGRWVGKNMPAFREEPYMNSLTNYLTKVEIELSNITYPGYYRFYTSSWNAVNDYLLNNDYFGKAISGPALYLSDEAQKIKLKNLSDEDKMKAACDAIRQKVKWNENRSVYTSGTDMFAPIKKGSGNSADINLILVQLLKKLGFDAFPVALSTRNNGIISPVYPTIDKFDYVIAGVNYHDKNYLFDATETYLPSGMLPFRVLNGRGRIINKTFSDWVDLSPEVTRKKTVVCDMKMNETGELNGSVTYLDYDYEAYYFRKDFKSYNSQDEYIKEVESEFPGLTVNSVTFENIDSINKPVTEKYDVSLTNYTSMIGDMISISPMLMERKDSNPFKAETRLYPIDYGYPVKSRYILTIAIPEGYEVAELPKACSIGLPDKSAKFTYQAVLNGNTVQLNAVFEISRSLYLETEYQLLKEFYNQVVAKEQEVIMLKKKA
jgi:hypothetical protein